MRKFLKDTLLVSVPVILIVVSILFLYPQLLFGFVPFILPFQGTIFVIIAFLVLPSLFLIALFGFLKYKIEKDIIENNYKAYKPFMYGFIGSAIMALIAILLLYIFSSNLVFAASSSTQTAVAFLGLLNIIYVILITIFSGVLGYYLYKTYMNFNLRMRVYYFLNTVLVLLIVIFYILWGFP